MALGMECSTQREPCLAETQQRVEVWQEEQEDRPEAAGSQQRQQEVQNREGEGQEPEQEPRERQEQQEEPILAPPLPQA